MARTPYSRAASSASASLSRSPERTTWPGALSLATVTSAAAAMARASSGVPPSSASIEPVSSASAIRRPRSTTRRSGVVERQDAGGVQRAELAERVAGGHGGLDVERRPAGDGGAEDGGLCEARALVHALEGVLAHELDDALEQVGELTRDVVAHVGGL